MKTPVSEHKKVATAHFYPARFSSEHLIKAVSKLTGRTEEKARQDLIDLYESNDGTVFATLVDYLAASFLGR